MVRTGTVLQIAAGCGLLAMGSALVTEGVTSTAPKLGLRQSGITKGYVSSRLEPTQQMQQMQRLKGGHGPASTTQGNGTPTELIICVSGIYFCYLYYGVLQEDLMTSKYDGKSFQEVCSLLFVVAMQCFIGAAFARISCATGVQPITGWQHPQDFKGFTNKLWPMYMQVGFCYVLAMLLSNSALFFINYPTQVIVKSCKMIPVMAVSVLVRGKAYPIAAYVRVAMVTFGIMCFTFFKKAAKSTKAGRQNSIFGLSLALGSLMMDGFVGPTQEEIFSHFHASTHQMMYYTNMWALLLLSAVMLLTGDGARAVGFVVKNPAVLSKILQFGLMSATGQFFIFFLVRSFSALTLVTVTTTRKFFTVLASVFWFKHSLTLGQWLSVAFVFSGLAWEETSKYIAKQRRRSEQVAPIAAPNTMTVPEEVDGVEGTSELVRDPPLPPHGSEDAPRTDGTQLAPGADTIQGSLSTRPPALDNGEAPTAP